jgi:hypothetical protein
VLQYYGMAVVTEAPKPREVITGDVLDSAQTTRRQVLNARLRRWSGWLIGGIAVGTLGAVIWPAAPLISVPLLVGGAIAEIVGLVGVTGNLVKGWFKKNK